MFLKFVQILLLIVIVSSTPVKNRKNYFQYTYAFPKGLEIGDSIGVSGFLGMEHQYLKILLFEKCWKSTCLIPCEFLVLPTYESSKGKVMTNRVVIQSKFPNSISSGHIDTTDAFKLKLVADSDLKWEFEKNTHYKIEFELIALHKLLVSVNDIPFAVFTYKGPNDLTYLKKIRIESSNKIIGMHYDYVKRTPVRHY